MDVIKDAKISADIATSTMNDLLMFDKISTSKFEIFTKITNGWTFLLDCVKPFKTQARLSQLTLSCTTNDDDSKPLAILIDKPKMEQVVRNFLTNAIKFTPSQGILRLQMSVHHGFTNGNPLGKTIGDAGVMRVSLNDTGPGISKVSTQFTLTRT